MKQRLLQLNLFLSEWKGRVPFTFMSVSLALRRANHARVERVPLTRSHCERITASHPKHATRRAEWASETIINYNDIWGLKCNMDKMESILFIKKRKVNKRIRRRGEIIYYKDRIKYLGVIFDKTLTMVPLTNSIVKKARQVHGALAPIIGSAIINLLKIEHQYRMALKTARQAPRRFPTTDSWEMLDWDRWCIRVKDLNEDTLRK
ncbi:hypothetical protein EVAR_30762_1 [Eumeta japonica]|uniref:Uncharacterized protein n=1 Tax=Eumeta variegata TaxID=151549 RepID=A0A4C1V6F0_EUMVA|nr:hypothetical protein EVAR_30762_1 [Eumeta japonica]